MVRQQTTQRAPNCLTLHCATSPNSCKVVGLRTFSRFNDMWGGYAVGQSGTILRYLP